MRALCSVSSALAFGVLVVFASACSSNDVAPAPTDASASDGATAIEGGAIDGGAVDAGADAEDGGSLADALVASCDGVDASLGPLVHETTGDSGAPPVLHGGPIAQGTYYLKSSSYYPNDAGAHTPAAVGVRVALRIRGTEARFAVLEETGVPNCAVFDFTTQNGVLSLSLQGQAAPPVDSAYEATQTTLRLLSSDGVLEELSLSGS